LNAVSIQSILEEKCIDDIEDTLSLRGREQIFVQKELFFDLVMVDVVDEPKENSTTGNIA